MSAAGCSTLRRDCWWASVAAELSIIRERNESGEDVLRSYPGTVDMGRSWPYPSVAESVLMRFDRSARLTFLCTRRCSGMSSGWDESRLERRRSGRSGVGDVSLYAMFFPE